MVDTARIHPIDRQQWLLTHERLCCIGATGYQGILRDDVMLINVGMSVVTIVVITTLGAFQQHLPGWADWFPFMVAYTLVGGVGFAFMFGLLMVEESDTGVRDAMLVTSISPNLFILTRTLVATVWMLIWPCITIIIMNSTLAGPASIRAGAYHGGCHAGAAHTGAGSCHAGFGIRQG